MAEWVVWSNQHGAWWGPKWRGYTTLFHEAGRYSSRDMRMILEKANSNLPAGQEYPDEVAICITEVAR